MKQHGFKCNGYVQHVSVLNAGKSELTTFDEDSMKPLVWSSDFARKSHVTP